MPLEDIPSPLPLYFNYFCVLPTKIRACLKSGALLHFISCIFKGQRSRSDSELNVNNKNDPTTCAPQGECSRHGHSKGNECKGPEAGLVRVHVTPLPPNESSCFYVLTQCLFCSEAGGESEIISIIPLFQDLPGLPIVLRIKSKALTMTDKACLAGPCLSLMAALLPQPPSFTGP